MGILDFLRKPDAALSVAASGIAFPWNGSPNTLQSVAYSDIFHGESELIDRAQAMSIPAVNRGRNLLCGAIAGLPLRATRNGIPTATQPTWLYRSDSDVSPYHRMSGTVDDLLFTGWAAWAVSRDARGLVIDAMRIPRERWSTDNTGAVKVDGKPVPSSEIILIPGPGPGLLETSQRSLRGAIALERAWIGRAQNPLPLVEIHETGSDSQLTEDEISELVQVYSAARTSPTGSVGFTDSRVELRVHGTVQADLFEAARNYSRLDLAAAMGLPGALLDATTSTASLTYSTREGQRNEFLDTSLRPYLDAIAARLSMDDVVPRGQAVRFDLTELTTPTTAPLGAPTED